MMIDGTYGETWVIVTSRRLLVYSPELRNGHRLLRVPLRQIHSVAQREYMGNGIIELLTPERAIEAARYSRSLSERMTDVVERIQQLAEAAHPEQKTIEFPDEWEQDSRAARVEVPGGRRRCKKCGRVLAHRKGDLCEACIEKRKLIYRLFTYLRPHWKLAVTGLSMTLVMTGIQLIPTYMTKFLIDNVIMKRNFVLLNVIMLIIIGVRVLSAGLAGIRTIIMTLLGQRIVLDLRLRVYRQLQYQSLSFYDKKRTGDLMTRVTRDTDRLREFITGGFEEMLVDILTMVWIGVLLFIENWQLALLALLPVPVIAIGTAVFNHIIHLMYHKVYRRGAAITSLLADAIPGVRVNKAFAQESREVEKFSRHNVEFFDEALKTAEVRAAFFPAMGLVSSISVILIWWLGAWMVMAPGYRLSLGGLMVFVRFMTRFYSPIQRLSQLNDRFMRAATAAERVFEVLDADQDVVSGPEVLSRKDIKGRIEFRDVTFGYEPSQEVLKNINLSIEPGEMIGLVGRSGVGKTTLVHLVCRFYDVTAGQILIDGRDVREYDLRSYRECIGVVLQDPFLFHGTIAENISYSRPGASPEEIIAAAVAANAHDFIMTFPDGYDTEAGERGHRLSGGEKQRISIARAILNNPQILILDEATASVDTETEVLIQTALARLIKGRTTFAIAHRLSTLRNADRIVVLEKGEIAECGTHDELVALGGTYGYLVNVQTELSKIRAV